MSTSFSTGTRDGRPVLIVQQTGGGTIAIRASEIPGVMLALSQGEKRLAASGQVEAQLELEEGAS